MMNLTDIWKDIDTNPSAPGIYPVLSCWDSHEGHIPRCSEWNGTEWGSRDAVVYWIDRKCESIDEASELARDNDPDL